VRAEVPQLFHWGGIGLRPGRRFSPASENGAGRPDDSPPRRAILLIEDDHDLASMYRHRLEVDGHTVTVAADGEEGLRLLREGDYDLMFLDVSLPKLDGLEVLAAVRADHALAELPVIILSNYDEPQLMERGLELGAREYLVKAETTPSQVAQRAHRWLN